MDVTEANRAADGRSVAVILPCYRVRNRVLGVISDIGPEVDRIYVVDDACPEKTGAYVEERCRDRRVTVLYHATNRGVGGAVMTGYRRAIEDGADVLVKVDGDGQLDPALIPKFIRPVLLGEADYAKGNRFFSLDGWRQIPRVRFWGNAALSFVSKLASGYWELFDPNNGFTAIHARVAELLPFDKISEGYFFESDMLFRLNTLRAVVTEIPMQARYGDEPSSLSPGRLVGTFALGHLRNTLKRVFYNYFLRGFSIASVNLVAGFALVSWGVVTGWSFWERSSAANTFASSGQVMLSALPIIVGTQMLLAFLSYDMGSTPRTPLHPRL